jgi:hypothetical protein
MHHSTHSGTVLHSHTRVFRHITRSRVTDTLCGQYAIVDRIALMVCTAHDANKQFVITLRGSVAARTILQDHAVPRSDMRISLSNVLLRCLI